MKMKRFIEAVRYDLGGQKDPDFKWVNGKEKDKYRQIIQWAAAATIVGIPIALRKYQLRKEDNFGVEPTPTVVGVLPVGPVALMERANVTDIGNSADGRSGGA